MRVDCPKGSTPAAEGLSGLYQGIDLAGSSGHRTCRGYWSAHGIAPRDFHSAPSKALPLAMTHLSQGAKACSHLSAELKFAALPSRVRRSSVPSPLAGEGARGRARLTCSSSHPTITEHRCVRALARQSLRIRNLHNRQPRTSLRSSGLRRGDSSASEHRASAEAAGCGLELFRSPAQARAGARRCRGGRRARGRPASPCQAPARRGSSSPGCRRCFPDRCCE
jgi:hypothetical protein